MLETTSSDRTIILLKTSRMSFFTCEILNCYFLAPIPKEKALEFLTVFKQYRPLPELKLKINKSPL